MTFKIHRRDKVKILSGRDLGKEGEVLRVYRRSSRVVVSGINLVKRHLKARGTQPAGIIEVERPFPISKIFLVCPTCQKPAKIGFRVLENKRRRICKICQGILP